MTSASIIADVDARDPLAYEEHKRLSSLAKKAHGAQGVVVMRMVLLQGA